MTTDNSLFGVLMMPLRGILAPLFDGYRKRDTRTMPFTVPAWAVSELPNTPIPYTVEHQYDFRYGGTYGPPDLPVSAGITNTERTMMTQKVSNGFNPRHRVPYEYMPYTGFNDEEGENIELFVHMPFALPTTKPCSTNMLLY